MSKYNFFWYTPQFLKVAHTEKSNCIHNEFTWTWWTWQSKNLELFSFMHLNIKIISSGPVLACSCCSNKVPWTDCNLKRNVMLSQRMKTVESKMRVPAWASSDLVICWHSDDWLPLLCSHITERGWILWYLWSHYENSTLVTWWPQRPHF